MGFNFLEGLGGLGFLDGPKSALARASLDLEGLSNKTLSWSKGSKEGKCKGFQFEGIELKSALDVIILGMAWETKLEG